MTIRTCLGGLNQTIFPNEYGISPVITGRYNALVTRRSQVRFLSPAPNIKACSNAGLFCASKKCGAERVRVARRNFTHPTCDCPTHPRACTISVGAGSPANTGAARAIQYIISG